MEFDPRAQALREVRRTLTSGAAIGSNRLAEAYWSPNKRYSKQSTSEDRGSDVRDEQTHLAAGRLSRLSVAILIDANRGLDVYKIRSLAAAAAALNERRGDTLTVQAIPFSRALIPRKDGWWLAYGIIVPALPVIVLGMIIILALRLLRKPAIFLARAFLTRRSVVQTQRAVSGFAPTQVHGALLHEPPHTAAAVISALPAATAAAVLDMYPADEARRNCSPDGATHFTAHGGLRDDYCQRLIILPRLRLFYSRHSLGMQPRRHRQMATTKSKPTHLRRCVHSKTCDCSVPAFTKRWSVALKACAMTSPATSSLGNCCLRRRMCAQYPSASSNDMHASFPFAFGYIQASAAPSMISTYRWLQTSTCGKATLCSMLQTGRLTLRLRFVCKTCFPGGIGDRASCGERARRVRRNASSFPTGCRTGRRRCS